jgi:osmotically-inducible protein OsmY
VSQFKTASSSHSAALLETTKGNEASRAKNPLKRNELGREEPTREQERLLAKVRQEIENSQYRAIRGVCCGFDSGVLTLSGSVPNYHCKQIAQEVVRRVSGTTEIQNSLQVDYLRLRSG